MSPFVISAHIEHREEANQEEKVLMSKVKSSEEVP